MLYVQLARANCGLPPERAAKIAICHFTVAQKHTGIPVFWRVSKTENLQAAIVEPDKRPTSVNHSPDIPRLPVCEDKDGGMRPFGGNLARCTEFGLLSIPIRLYPAARSQRTYLHQLHNKCHTRLKRALFCPTCNRIVGRDEVVKGYEYEQGQYVLVDDEDLKKITRKSGKTMEILAFVKREKIDPIYLDASYFTLPDKDAGKAYQVLLKALEDTGRVGIAQVNMHQRDYTVFIRPRNHGITVHTMYFQNEIREVPGYGEKPSNLHLKPEEIKLAEQLIETLSEDFNPAKYHDTFQERLRALVEAKQKGKTVTERPVPRQAQVIDMMEALKNSLRETARAGKRRRVSAEHAAASRNGKRLAS
jgi:DNA end-binding protein Ku